MALVDAGARVGAGSRVWAFAHIVKGAVVGRHCNVCDLTFIEGKVRVGNRVTIKCGVHLWDGVVVEDDVFIGPGAAFINDRYPRSKRYPAEFLKTLVQKGASIGANATVLPGLVIGKWAMVGAGAVVTKDVPDFALVLGNPARFVSWICPCGRKLKSNQQKAIRCMCGKQYRLSGKGQLREVSKRPVKKRRGLSS